MCNGCEPHVYMHIYIYTGIWVSPKIWDDPKVTNLVLCVAK